MHREKLVHLLSSYQERHPEEQILAGRISSFVESNRDCFERTLKIGHITGSAWVLNPSSDQVLFTHHQKLDIWVQLGGHADGQSDVSMVAVREAREESGIDDIDLMTDEIFDVDIHEIPAFGDEPAHDHYDIRFLLQAEHMNYQVSRESKDLAWIKTENLNQYSQEESILRMNRKWINLAGKLLN